MSIKETRLGRKGVSLQDWIQRQIASSTAWILLSGFWNDNGKWKDTSTWND